MPEWERLLHLAHVDKSRAFAEYARHYTSTDGQLYWSDTHQLASYIDGYHAAIDRRTASAVAGSEMISELYVRAQDLPAFMSSVRDDARLNDVNIIYGTIRLIERDDESVLAWAREPWACVVFNLHVDHSPSGIDKAQRDFRGLIARAIDFRRELLPDLSPLGHRGAGGAVPPSHARLPRAEARLRPRRRVHERLVRASRTFADFISLPAEGRGMMASNKAWIIGIVAFALLAGDARAAVEVSLRTRAAGHAV